MAGLYLDLTPAYLYTQNGEPDRIPIQNRIVMELRNPSPEESVILKNDAKKEYIELPSYDMRNPLKMFFLQSRTTGTAAKKTLIPLSCILPEPFLWNLSPASNLFWIGSGPRCQEIPQLPAM